MKYKAGEYEVIVIGGGHAGCEAALASARMGCRTLLLTLNIDNIALMPCNPAVGGPAKGHLVREVDALGGEIGINTDQTLIQVRLLNTGKGPAVRAIRAQCDKKFYQRKMILTLESQENLTVKEAVVEKIISRGDKVRGVITRNGAEFKTQTLVLTTGTYLRGKIIVGDIKYSGGPSGQQAAVKLTDSLKDLGLEVGRFKTGTPPRVDRRTVDFKKMKEQPGDTKPLRFSFMSEGIIRPNVSCWLTNTNKKTHEIIRSNLHRAPLFSGTIEGIGPRYCPSIEDKVVRFEDKESHQVFLEPEGMDTYEMYVQGMSTSLPEDVQQQMLRSINGMENVTIMRTGYAIEYDIIWPVQLHPTLETKNIKGLFTAGQINGTSGYEEAAAQGILAGINAALVVKEKEKLVIKRSEAYIGVLVDDLVTKGIEEPYRMLTSRAEYRLLLRHDNADERLTELGWKIGLASKERMERFFKKKKIIKRELQRLSTFKIKPGNKSLNEMLVKRGTAPLKKVITAAELLKRPEISYRDLKNCMDDWPDLDPEIEFQVETEIKYEGYIKKQKEQVERFQKLEDKKLPDWDYMQLEGLSREAQEKLNKIRPISLGQASRISGVSPADINVLLILLEKRKRSGSVP